ncbi:MAG: hypothetical protein LJF04_15465 [Gemmatimonadetes bacterium]|nr:hypothetical protein [Gemmatimonadota bacterium]
MTTKDALPAARVDDGGMIMTTPRIFAGGDRLALRTAVLAAAFAFLTPPSGWAATSSSDSGPAVRSAPPTLQVNSDSWQDVEVYMVRDGDPFSLGVVDGMGTAHLEVPALATTPGSQVQILAMPLGGGEDYLSRTIMVNPGDTIDLTLQAELPSSFVRVTRGA